MLRKGGEEDRKLLCLQIHFLFRPPEERFPPASSLKTFHRARVHLPQQPAHARLWHRPMGVCHVRHLSPTSSPRLELASLVKPPPPPAW